MIADLKPYAEYKESGLPWLGQVPGHWTAETLRRFLKPGDGIKIGPFGSQLKLAHMSESGFKVYGQANVIAGDIRRGSKYVDRAKFEQLRECEVCPGDLLVTMMGTSGRCMVVPGDAVPGLMDSHLLRLRLRTNSVGPAFTALSVDQAPYVKQQVQMAGKGSIMQGLNSGMVKNLALLIPPPDEQAAIVRFLDWANGRLERAIRAKRKVIALLNEQKQAIIHRAVTRGLDPSVPLKPSGIPWLGDIPQHWEVRRLKSISRFVTSGSRGWARYYADAGFVFLRIGNISTTSIDLRLKRITYVTPPDGAEGERTRAIPDDLLLSITAQIGAVGVVPKGLGEAFVNQHTALIRLRQGDSVPRWVAYGLLSSFGKDQCRLMTNGGTKVGLTLDDVRCLVVLLPPLEEQAAIVAGIERQTSDLDSAISRLEREIELLREYRTRLVADVVTGKLDVREAAARLPDEAPLDSVEDDADLGDEAETADEEPAV